MSSSEFDLTLIELQDKINFVPIPYNSGRMTGNMEIVNCSFNGGYWKN